MAEESWHAARLIPTSGISGAEEQERRATSALLAVLSSVKEFHRAILAPLGAPAGRVEAYIEVPFKLGDKVYRPDGLIRVTRGAKSWTALVEVKTGKNPLAGDQLEAYLDIARDHGFDCLLTISNEIPPTADQAPHGSRSPQAPQGRDDASVVGRRPQHRGPPEGAPRSVRSRPGLDPWGAHPLLGAPQVRCDGVRGHGGRTGSRCARRSPLALCAPRTGRSRTSRPASTRCSAIRLCTSVDGWARTSRCSSAERNVPNLRSALRCWRPPWWRAAR